MSSQPGLHVDGVSKVFAAKGGPVQALDAVSLSLEAGRVGVLLGPSGCGKSTLLRMVAGLEHPTDGIIHLNGRAVTRPGRDRGMVFQDYTSFPWLSVRQNVAYGLKINGDETLLREGTVDHFIRAVGLERFADAYPHQLSGGMRQRVALARTLAICPELLLMDEPFGALDPETRWQMQDLLLGIVRKERNTVLLVSHDIEEALYLGDVVFFLSSHPGRLREVIVPDFKQTLPDDRRETFLQSEDYRRLELHIRRLMSEEGRAVA
ncbi:ABC transporter ATP-binding protein [Marinobacteraceae bacterium S3BR75-40.1]